VYFLKFFYYRFYFVGYIIYFAILLIRTSFSQNLDIYIYKHSIKTTDIGLTAVIADSPTKFEIWFRKRKPGDTYTLQCASEDIKKAWTEELSNLLWKQALRNRGDLPHLSYLFWKKRLQGMNLT